MNKLELFSCRIPGDINCVAGAADDVLCYLTNVYGEMSECTLFELRVVLNELILNAVKHGVKGDKSRFIDIKAGITRDKSVLLLIEDDGDGCNYNEVMKNTDSNYYIDLCDMKETGRGILIVKNLCEEVRFNKKGNRVLVKKKLAGV